MAWEDDALDSYKAGRARKAQESTLAMQRNELLSRRHARMWNDLRDAILKACYGINERAGETILESKDIRANHLKIQRDDSKTMLAEYDPATHKVKIESDTFPFVEQVYELSIRTVNGNDAVVWMKLPLGDVESLEIIAQYNVERFLRAN